jgi:hypothetical protein
VHGDLELPSVALSMSAANWAMFSVWKLLVGYAVGISTLRLRVRRGYEEQAATAAHGMGSFHCGLRSLESGSVADGGERRSVRNAAL